jgi:hypothetical protein
VMAAGWVVWEEGKYVSVSRRRFQSVQADRDAGILHIALRGAVSEVIRLTVLRPGGVEPYGEEWTVVSVNATVGSDGTVSVVVR